MAVHPLDGAARFRADAPSQVGVAWELAQKFHHLLLAFEEQAVVAVSDVFGMTAEAVADHRQATGHGFEDDVRKGVEECSRPEEATQ